MIEVPYHKTGLSPRGRVEFTGGEIGTSGTLAPSDAAATDTLVAVAPSGRYSVKFRAAPSARGGMLNRPEYSPAWTASWPSRRRDCHFADTPSSSLLERLLDGRGGCSRMSVSPTAIVAVHLRAVACETK